jgi:hypothetical protein
VQHRLAPILPVLFVLAAACGNEPTPSGTVILDESLESEASGTLEGSEETTEELALEGGAKVTVALTTARAGEGRFIRRVRVTTADAAGAEVTASLTGNPTNLGTEAAPVHSRIVLVSESRSGLTGTSLNQTSFTVRADGRVEKN